jgi:hypothetical protein
VLIKVRIFESHHKDRNTTRTANLIRHMNYRPIIFESTALAQRDVTKLNTVSHHL